jgi:hypothetical protein
MAGSSSLSGADVGHPAPGLKNHPSVASLAWSYYDRFVAHANHLICHPITKYLSRDEADKSGNCPAGFVVIM